MADQADIVIAKRKGFKGSGKDFTHDDVARHCHTMNSADVAKFGCRKTVANLVEDLAGLLRAPHSTRGLRDADVEALQMHRSLDDAAIQVGDIGSDVRQSVAGPVARAHCSHRFHGHA